MGLDTSHGCWHGPYSQFMHWRVWLHYFVMREREAHDPKAAQVSYKGATREGYIEALNAGMYDDQSVPINVLMNHSDCDGEILTEDCDPLADALEKIMERYMPPRGTYDEMRPPTERFIKGLRLAATRGEIVTFG